MHAGFGIDVYAVGLRSCQKSPLSRTYHLTLRSRMQSGRVVPTYRGRIPQTWPAIRTHACMGPSAFT